LIRIRAGYTISYDSARATPMALTLTVHPSRAGDLLTPGPITFSPGVIPRAYQDRFGNIVTRIITTPGRTTISTDFEIIDSGLPDAVRPEAVQHPVEDLPDSALLFLLGSRYCETDRLSDAAWSMFGTTPPGWGRVQAICTFVHNHLAFGYQHARSTRTAWEAYQERIGVCRDFAHLAVTLCRCMNIPARYCTGYLGDIGVPRSPDPMDFSAWFEAFLGGAWYTFDARHNTPRIGRILIGRGRDATDVAISNSFGPARLSQFTVVTEEVAAVSAGASLTRVA
jgi:transglutaminase-like putative cysteine protease